MANELSSVFSTRFMIGIMERTVVIFFLLTGHLLERNF